VQGFGILSPPKADRRVHPELAEGSYVLIASCFAVAVQLSQLRGSVASRPRSLCSCRIGKLHEINISSVARVSRCCFWQIRTC
jgi:hypothetical protein